MKCWIVAVIYMDGRPPKFYRLRRPYKPDLEELTQLGVKFDKRKDVWVERISARLWAVIDGEYLR